MLSNLDLPIEDYEAFEVVDLPEENPSSHDFYNETLLLAQVQHDLSIASKFRPDVVIADHRVSLYIAAEYLKVPWFLVETFARSRHSADVFGLPRGASKETMLEASMLWRDFNRELVSRKYSATLERFGIDPAVDSVNSIGNPAASLLTDAWPLGAVTPSKKALTVGPCLWPSWPETATPDGVEALLRKRPALLTFGGTMYDQAKLNELIDSINQSTIPCIVTTGKNLSANQIMQKGNLLVTRYIRLDRILRNCSVVFCHGGHQTVMRALLAGVPCVCLPYNHDQLNSAVRVDECGLGLNLNPQPPGSYGYRAIFDGAKKVSVRDIWAAIRNVQETSDFQETAADVSADLSVKFSAEGRDAILAGAIGRALELPVANRIWEDRR